MAEMRAMVARYAEACFLLRTLGEHNVGRLAARLDEPTRERVRRLTLRQLACDPEGDALASQLISALISEHLASQVSHQLHTAVCREATTGSAVTVHFMGHKEGKRNLTLRPRDRQHTYFIAALYAVSASTVVGYKAMLNRCLTT